MDVVEYCRNEILNYRILRLIQLIENKMKSQIIALISFLTILLPQYVFSQTEVSGIIDSNTTWLKENSPYLVTDNILVESGITLTIEPGTVIEFNANKYIRSEGALIAIGEFGDSIYFKSRNTTKWKGLEFKSGGGTIFENDSIYLSGSIIRHVKIENATLGLFIQSTGLLIEKSILSNATTGIEVRNTTNVLIDSVNFIGNNTGITSLYEPSGVGTIANFTIKNSYFISNQIAIDLIMNQREFNNLKIENNTFKSNNLAIDFGGGGYGPRVHSVFIKNNFFTSNTNSIRVGKIYGQNGDLDFPVQITKNLIEDSELGIEFDFSQVNCLIDQNRLQNINFGIKADGWSRNQFEDNILEDNDNPITIGSDNNCCGYVPTKNAFIGNTLISDLTNDLVKVQQGSGVSFSENNFIVDTLGTGYIIDNRTGSNINAQGNYWSLTSEESFSSKIYDKNDDFNKGEVDFTSYLSSPTQNTPISTPQNVFKGLQDGGVVHISWSSNKETNLAGYKIYSKENESDDYFLLFDVGNVTSYSTDLVSNTDFIAIKAYSDEADGESDFLEGNESDFSVSAENFIFNVSLSSSSICQGEFLEISLSSNHIFTNNEFILQLSSLNGSFDEAINLDSISDASEMLSSLLPDTLQIGERYLVRVFSSELSVFSESFEIIPYSIPTSSFDLEASICSVETSTITYTGDGSTEATYSWGFDGATVVSGSGQGPYELSWATEGTKSITLEVSENGCTSFTESQIQIKKTPTADFSVQTQLCEGESALILYTGNANDTATFTWDFDEGTIISGDGSGPFEVAWDSFGMKTISLSVEEDGCSTDQEVQEINYNQYPSMSFEANESTCYNEDYSITFTGSNYTDLNWSFDGANIISGSGAGPYILSWNSSGTKFISLNASNNGCTRDTTLLVEIPEKPYNPDICLVTVDEASSKNMLIWEYDLESVSQFGIYRETNVSGEYSLVEFIEGDISNTYIDNQSSPSQQSNRYKVTSLDSCGTETELSNYHKTIHLTINKGIGNTWNLIWDGYEGFSFGTYRIYRNLNNSDFELLTDIASNLTSFSDTDVTTTDVAYQIEVVSPNSCGVSESGRLLQTTTSRSNIARNTTVLGRTSINDQIEIFPNPTSDYLNIESSSDRLESYELMTLTGQVIQEGELTGKDIVSLKGIPIGVYLLSVSTTEGRINKRIVKK
jgi:hypothetical protein